jgi:hypothetical protein
MRALLRAGGQGGVRVSHSADLYLYARVLSVRHVNQPPRIQHEAVRHAELSFARAGRAPLSQVET